MRRGSKGTLEFASSDLLHLFISSSRPLFASSLLLLFSTSQLFEPELG